MRHLHVFRAAVLGLSLSILPLCRCPAASPGTLRYHGLYASADSAGTPKSTHYLRFYPDGTVVGATSTGSPSDVARWLNRKKASHSGKYHLRCSAISFSVAGFEFSADYSGTISPTELVLRIHSYNGYR